MFQTTNQTNIQPHLFETTSTITCGFDRIGHQHRSAVPKRGLSIATVDYHPLPISFVKHGSVSLYLQPTSGNLEHVGLRSQTKLELTEESNLNSSPLGHQR